MLIFCTIAGGSVLKVGAGVCSGCSNSDTSVSCDDLALQCTVDALLACALPGLDFTVKHFTIKSTLIVFGACGK